MSARSPPTDIIVRYGSDVVTHDHKLTKFARSNQGTCVNQRPIVNVGERGRRRARSSPTARPTANGEIALGKNVLIGFMTWEGYNYEDAVLLNETPGAGGCVHLHSY